MPTKKTPASKKKTPPKAPAKKAAKPAAKPAKRTAPPPRELRLAMRGAGGAVETRTSAPRDDRDAELRDVAAALDDARADARAARDEVARLATENERLRALLDQAPAPAPAPAPPAAPAPSADLLAQIERARIDARLARSELAALREDYERERVAAAVARDRLALAERAHQGQLDEARAETARAAAEARDLRDRVRRLVDENARLRGG